MAVLQIRNLTKYYKDVLAVSDVSFNVKEGELLSIIGPSGSGKSTILRCMNRMIEASSGEIIFDKIDILKMPKRSLRTIRSKIGMIFQHYNLVNRLTVMENVLHGRLGYKSTFDGIIGNYTRDEKTKALEILHRLGLEEQIYKRCDTLSGGQKQRVGIARALIQEPRIILCDEPIASLDPSASKIIMDNLKKVCTDFGITVLVNLHQVDVAKKYADRIIGINGGQIVFNDKASNLDKKTIRQVYGAEAGDLIID
jgi:phosphonate transport system ATP-binding protein